MNATLELPRSLPQKGAIIYNRLLNYWEKGGEVGGLNRETMSDRIRKQLSDDIVMGRYRPGQRLLPAELAETYNVSHIPVREALHSLEATGLVVSEPNRWIYVSRLSPKDLEQVLSVRKSLEALALRQAVDHVTPEVLADLRTQVGEMAAAVDDSEEWLDRNRKFHMGIFALAENRVLLDLIEQLWTKMEPYLRVYGASMGNFSDPKREHDSLVDALEERRLDDAIEIQEEHITRAGEIVERALEREREREAADRDGAGEAG